MTQDPRCVLAGAPFLEYQPAVDLATGRLLGFEALLRWQHPTRGLISPGVVIPWAEANGDIVELNAWVLAEACSQAQRWPSGIQLAVNCSIVQLRQGEASRSAARALERSGLNPDRLSVEVTEHTIADARAAADLQALSALGVHLAVDDVGTMWSSLGALRQFAVETVKIDAAFIANLESDEGVHRAIVEAIVRVGHSLAMSTVAEGVETAAQTAILRELGADVAQGYFFARPLPVDETLALATAETRAVFPLTVSGGIPHTDHHRHAPRRSLVLVPNKGAQASTSTQPHVTGTPGTSNSGTGPQMPSFGALALDVAIDQSEPGPGTRLCLDPASWPDFVGPDQVPDAEIAPPLHWP